MKAFFKQYMAEYLKSNGINIHEIDYKRSKNYSEVKGERIFCGNDGFMTIEEYIERYLLEEHKVIKAYESIYDMGNPVELIIDEDCQYIALAREIISNMDLAPTINTEAEATEFSKKFNRPGGLIERLKTYLNFDIDSFNADNGKHKCEIFKILYFFYMLENKHFPKINVFKLLSKPSMESIDNSFFKWKTWHGSVVKVIKESLEKELSPCAKNNIKGAVAHVVSVWENLLEDSHTNMDLLAGSGYECDFEDIMNSLKSVPIHINQKAIEYKHSPIETLYLKVLQYEQVGQIKDIMFVNKLLPQADYYIPECFIKEMKELHDRKVNINDIENYIDKNAAVIAKYIYLKLNTNKEEHRRIRYHKEKVVKIIKFCGRARLFINKKVVATELWIISCLQAIISDSGNEIFDYTFHGYESMSKRTPHVQGALKGDKQPYDALQIYWVRKVTDRWYANLGRYDSRMKLRELEDVCDKILLGILGCPNIDEMLQLHSLYYNNL